MTNQTQLEKYEAQKASTQEIQRIFAHQISVQKKEDRQLAETHKKLNIQPRKRHNDDVLASFLTGNTTRIDTLQISRKILTKQAEKTIAKKSPFTPIGNVTHVKDVLGW